MPRIRSSDDEVSDSSAVRKLKNSVTNVSSPLRRSSRIKEITREHSPKQLRGRTVRAASECSSPVTKVTRRNTRASSVDTDEVASPARPRRKPAVRTLAEEPDEVKEPNVTTRKKAAAAKPTKPKENLDTSNESAKGSSRVTRKTRSKDSLNSSKDSNEAERRDEQRSTKSVVNSKGKKKVLKGSVKESSSEKEIRIVLERIPLADQIKVEPLKKAEIKSGPLNEDENTDVISLDGSVSSSGIGSILESDLGRRKQHFDITDEIREKSQQLIDKYQIPLKSVEIVEIISGPDTDAEVIVDEDDEVSNKNNKDSTLTIPIHHSTLLCDKNDHDHLRKLFVNGSSPVAGTEDNSKEKTERPKTPLDNVVEVAVESDDSEIFSPNRSAKKKLETPVVETAEATDNAPSETDPAEKPSEEFQLAREDSIHLCLEERNTEDKNEGSPKKSPKKTPIKVAASRRKSVTFAMKESSQDSDEDEVSKNLSNFFNNRTPAKKFDDKTLFDETAVDETEPMECEDITSPEKSLKIGREDENKQEEAQKNDSAVNEKEETLGDISRKATKDSDSESLNSSFEDSKAEKNAQKVVDDSDDTSVKDSEKGEEIDMNRSRVSMSKEKRSSTKIDTVVEETEDSDEDTVAGNKTLNKSKEETADLNESRKSIGKNRKSRLVEVVSEDSVDDMFGQAVNKSLNKSKEDRQSVSKSIQEDIHSRKSTEKEPAKKRSFSRIIAKEPSSDDEIEVPEKNKTAEEPAKESEKLEEIVISSDKNSSEKEEDMESEEIAVGEDEVQLQDNADEDEEDSPAFSPVSDLSDDEQEAQTTRKSLNVSQKKTEEPEDPKTRKSLNQSQKVEISRKSLEMEKENIENDKGKNIVDTEKSVEGEGTKEDLETSKKLQSVTPQKRQSLQLEVEEKNESLDKSQKSLDEIKALKEVSNSPVKDRKSLQTSVKEVSLRVELDESSKSRKSLEAVKEKKARESLEKNQSMEVDSEEEKEKEPEAKPAKTRKSLNESKFGIELDTSKSGQSLYENITVVEYQEKEEENEEDSEEEKEEDSEEEKEPAEKPAKARKSLNESKVKKELETSKSRQSLKNKTMEVDSEEEEEENEEEPEEKPTKTRKSLNESKVEKEMEKVRKSLNASKKIEEEVNLSKSRKSLNQSHKTEDKLETSSRKSLNKSQKAAEDNDESLDKSQDESDEEDLPEETDLNDTYNKFIEAVVHRKSLTIDSDDESVSIDEKDLDKTSSEDEDLDDEEEEPLESQDKDAGEIDMSGVKRLRKTLEPDFKDDEGSKANKSMNKSMNKSVEKKDKSLSETKEKLPTFMYSASESENDKSVDEMDADIVKEYNLDGETIMEYSDDNVIADDIRASETESSEEEEEDSDLDDFIVDEVSEEEEEEDEEEDVDEEEEDEEDGEGGEKQEESLEEKQTALEKKSEMLEKSVEKKRKSDVAKINESAKRQSTSNKTIFLESDDDNEVMNYDDSCIVEESVNLGKPLIKSIVSAQFKMSTPNAGKKASRMSKSFENVSALDNTLLAADMDTSKKSKSRKSDARKSLHQSLPLPQEESSPEQPAERVKSSLSRTISGRSTDTPVTKHLKKSKMNDTEPIMKLSEDLPKSEKKKKKSHAEAVADIINTEVPTEKNNESLNVSSKKKNDRTLVEETETVEEDKKKSKKSKTKQKEVVEKKSKKKKVLEIEDVEVPPTDYQFAAKVNTVEKLEESLDEVLVKEKPKKAKKRSAETETVQGKRKRNETEESAKSSKIKVPEIASLKRRRDDLSNSVTEIRTKKRQRTDDVKIVASSSGSTTHFEVVTITKQKSKAPKALQSYRQRMLSRNQMQPSAAYANYQLKLKAAGRNKS